MNSILEPDGRIPLEFDVENIIEAPRVGVGDTYLFTRHETKQKPH